ncbi:MAG: minor capsid protein [Bacteroidia bacterium]|nr:minor capsid protein [Bacteroidia bacterium]
MPTKIEKLFVALSEKVHSGELTPGQIDKEVTTFVANNLLKGVFTGFENDFDSVDYDTPDHKMLAHLEKNVYYFSAAKQYHEVVELNEALRDGKRVLTFQEFKEKAFAINEKYNANYLRAEYNHAIASSQMARRWVDIQEAKETHPLLRYDTVGDDRVRPAHKSLEGITKPIDDPFWNTWYPPNGWNCRCDVRQMQDGKITPTEKINTPTDTPDIFKINTAKQGMVYPPKHPYWALPAKHIDEVIKSANELWKSNSKGYKTINSFSNGGRVEAHAMADKIDLEYNTIESSWWAEKTSAKIKILPHSTDKYVKNAEIIYNNVLSDFKETKKAGTIKSIRGLCKKAKNQKTGAVHIKLTHPDLTADIVQKGLRSFFIDNQMEHGIETVYLRKGEKYCILDAQDIIEWNHKTPIKKLFK